MALEEGCQQGRAIKSAGLQAALGRAACLRMREGTQVDYIICARPRLNFSSSDAIHEVVVHQLSHDAAGLLNALACTSSKLP